MTQKIPVVEHILNANDKIATQIRDKLDKHHVLGMNILASPGSGKTSFILSTIALTRQQLRLGVIEGDTADVTIDADKILGAGMPAIQINTGGQCHLDANMIAQSLSQLPLADIDLLIVENVGNLICPASFALGTHFNIVIASVPEGDDKPYKYPNIYRDIDVLILNKIDLLPYIDFDIHYFQQGIEVLNPDVQFFQVSCKTGQGMTEWGQWLTDRVAAHQAQQTITE